MNPKDAVIETVTVSECPYPEGTAKAVLWEKLEEQKLYLAYHVKAAGQARTELAEAEQYAKEATSSISDLQAALKKLEGE